MDGDLEKSRRNLMTVSLAIILLYAAGGEIHSAFGIIQFERGWVLILFLWLAEGWFFWRFNNHARSRKTLFMSNALTRLGGDKQFSALAEELSTHTIPKTDYDLASIVNKKLRRTPDGVACAIEYLTYASGGPESGGATRRVGHEPRTVVPKSQYKWLLRKAILIEAYYGEEFPTIIAPYLFAITAVLFGLYQFPKIIIIFIANIVTHFY